LLLYERRRRRKAFCRRFIISNPLNTSLYPILCNADHTSPAPIMSDAKETTSSQEPLSEALINGIDMHNPDTTHERNADILRNFSIKRNVFNLFARSPGLFPPIMDTLSALLDGKTRIIQILDYQLVVLRMTGLVGAEYLFGINEPVSRVNRMGEEKIEALRRGLKSEQLFATGIWSERQQCIITLVDESVATWTNTEETIRWVQSLMSDDEVVELYIVLGFYSMIARMTRGLRVQKDPPIPNLSKTIVQNITKNEKEQLEEKAKLDLVATL
jgi:hypothetical protein